MSSPKSIPDIWKVSVVNPMLKRPAISAPLQERSRAVPVLSSSEYGRRRPALCLTEQQYARVASIKSEIYRKNGILWNVEEGYGSVFPN